MSGRQIGLTALGVAFVLALLAPFGPARPALAREFFVSRPPPPGFASRSVGFPWQGSLRSGVRLRASQYIRHVAEYVPGGHFYGTWELVRALERAARGVAFRLPGARLAVGELSRRAGGRIPGHNSHENGRDVDLGFYVTDKTRKPQTPDTFVNFGRTGRGRGDHGHLRFDDARNWELVSRLLADPDTSVQYIFVSDSIRRRLLRTARQRRAPEWLRRRASIVLRQPDRGHPHRNHFHVRIYCPVGHRPSCRDRKPYWPWYRALSARGPGRTTDALTAPPFR